MAERGAIYRLVSATTRIAVYESKNRNLQQNMVTLQ